MALVDLAGRPSAAEVTLQEGDPIWHRHYGGIGVILVPGEFKGYGRIRCVVDLHRTDAQRFVTVDPRNVFPREPGEGA